VFTEKEEQVLLVFGKYHDTIRSPGMHWVNPIGLEKRLVSTKRQNMDVGGVTNPIKVADGDGNPVIVSGVVGYRIINSKAAALEVENARSFVHTQAQTILKQVVSRYPYEATDGSASLKSETYEIGIELCRALQEKSTVAGVLIESFELADLSYAPEIAQVMLVRQQAKAMVDARGVVVEGAVGIVRGAVEQLAEAGIPLDEKETSKLVTNLLTVICGDQGAQPVITL
jgi:regulator of protease activity HflC (stomatin/prohibitin superfamily)